MTLQATLVRFRVPLGFAAAAIGMVLARPTPGSLLLGGAIAAVGEGLRVWAAGHLEKSREVTRTGPYRFLRHPLYLGSAIIGLGFVVIARDPWAALLAAVYLAVTLQAAARSEEAHLDAKFGGEYSAYRDGRAAPVERPFSLARVRANGEPRTMLGLGLGLGLLYLRSLL
jgi:protein-S-isoprenylcysteine O-methyltransferase Ste14